MDHAARIERSLHAALEVEPGGPPLLLEAVRHAVFPGGGRVRPRLCLAAAAACGGADAALAEAAAAAAELLHCASLVHDDLPCFDDAPTRRGLPSVQARFGEALAVLAGDALIVLGFEVLARAGAPARTMLMLARAAGVPHGLAAGQGWEQEPAVALRTYQRAKTAELFAFAAGAGALAAGHDAAPWRVLGERLGEAYQIADDLRDVLMAASELGKPAGRDAALGRPSAAATHGPRGALERVEGLVAGALAAVPECPGREALRGLIRGELERLLPAGVVLRAAA